MIFSMFKSHSNFIAKKLRVWSSLLQNGTSACPGSLYIGFIGHIILDEWETSLGTAALYTNCWLGNCWRTWIAMNCWFGMWPCYKRHMRMPPYFVAIECYKRRKTTIFGHLHSKIPLYISKEFPDPVLKRRCWGSSNLDENSAWICWKRIL